MIGVDSSEAARGRARLEFAEFSHREDCLDVTDELFKSKSIPSTIIVCVPTPSVLGKPDLTYIQQAVQGIEFFLSRQVFENPPLIILESTSFPGTTREEIIWPIEARLGLSCGRDFLVAFSSERIDPGNPIPIEEIPKVVGGYDERSLERAIAFYCEIFNQVVPVSSLEVAEMSKLIENSFRLINIAFVNELAIAAKLLKIDIYEAIDAASSKPFGFMAFHPGPGIGGHCIPEDPVFLDWAIRRETGEGLGTLSSAFKGEELTRNHLVSSVQDFIESMTADSREARNVSEPEIVLLGLSYKANVGDTRNSPALRLAQSFATGAQVRVFDPHVEPSQFPSLKFLRQDEIHAAMESSTAIVFMTAHSIFGNLRIEKFAPKLLDATGRLRMLYPNTLWHTLY